MGSQITPSQDSGSFHTSSDSMKRMGEETEYEVTLAPAGIPLDKAIHTRTLTFTFTTDAKQELVEGRARGYSEIP